MRTHLLVEVVAPPENVENVEKPDTDIEAVSVTPENEKFSADVVLHKPNKTGSVTKIKLMAKAYESNFGHFMVFYQERTCGKATNFINLKNCNVNKISDTTISIASTDYDGKGITKFDVCDLSDMDRWLEALAPKVNYRTLPMGSRSPVIPRAPMMPVLGESEESD